MYSTCCLLQSLVAKFYSDMQEEEEEERTSAQASMVGVRT